MHTSKNLRDLQAKKSAQVASARAITDLATKEARDLTDDESTRFDALTGNISTINAAIDRETALLAEEASVPVGKGNHIEVTDLAATDEKRGFKSKAEFFSSLIQASVNPHRIDPRLSFDAAAPSVWGGEASGADGGFLVPPEFSKEIWSLSQVEDSLLPLTDNYDISSNGMVFPKDETTPWGTDGIRAYWQQEASSAQATKPKLGVSQLRLHKLMGLVPLTDELMEDTTALASYLPRKIGDSIRWKTNEALLFGTGVGQPLGCFNSSAAIVSPKDTGQATQTLSLSNLTNMIARLIPGCFPRAIWMTTPDLLPSLFGLTLGNYPIYLPTDKGAQGSPYGTLLGRPLMVSQHANAFSSQGDMLLFDPKYIRTITKPSGIQSDVSIHLYFDADVTAFRTIFRIDGQPTIAQPVTQAKGSNTLSAFLQLGAR